MHLIEAEGGEVWFYPKADSPRVCRRLVSQRALRMVPSYPVASGACSCPRPAESGSFRDRLTQASSSCSEQAPDFPPRHNGLFLPGFGTEHAFRLRKSHESESDRPLAGAWHFRCDMREDRRSQRAALRCVISPRGLAHAGHRQAAC